MSVERKKVLKHIEADLQKEVDVEKARSVIKSFLKKDGHGVPMILVQEAVKTMCTHVRKQAVEK